MREGVTVNVYAAFAVIPSPPLHPINHSRK